MKDLSEPRNLDDFTTVCHGILQTGPWNLAQFSAEKSGVLVIKLGIEINYIFGFDEP